MVISDSYNNILKSLEPDINQIKQLMNSGVGKNSLYEQAVVDFLNSPSKYIRSVFTILYLKAKGYEINHPIIRLMSVIELIHSGSLVHDDIIDKSEIRRNKKTFNAEYGEHFSVIAGDYILALALKHIAELNSKEVTGIIATTISNMCCGEFSQYYMRNKIPTIDEYIKKTYQKTGALFEAALRCSVLLLKKSISPETIEFAKNFGIAFQIKNDINDLDKNCIDSDINNGIYTAPIIFAENTNDFTSGIEKANNLLDNYLQEARAYVLQLDDNIYRTSLLKLLELLEYE